MINHHLIEQQQLRNIKIRSMSKSQRAAVESIIMKDYFTHPDNGPSDISQRTGFNIKIVSRILNLIIVQGANLIELKIKYTQ